MPGTGERQKKVEGKRRSTKPAGKAAGGRSAVKKKGAKVRKKRSGGDPSVKTSAPAEPAPEPAPDPWRVMRSPYGGKLSDAEEYGLLESSRPWQWRAWKGGEERCSPGAGEGAGEVSPKGDDGGEVTGVGDSALAPLPGTALRVRPWPGAPSVPEDLLASAGCLVALDVSGADVCAATLSELLLPWLRDLRADACGLETLPLPRAARLLRLHVARNPLRAPDPGAVADRAPLLRELDVSACLVEDLAFLSAFPRLLALDVSHNMLADARAVRPVTDCGRVARLAVAGNPWCARADFADELKKLRRRLPCLRTLDGADASLVVVGAGAGALAEAAARSVQDTVLGGDAASCSCVEGTPCAVAYNCRDWDRRFEVARAAREESISRK